MAGLTAQSDVADLHEVTRPVYDHKGSASMYLTGSKVLLVWLGSILLHGTGLGITLLLVFPFTSHQRAEAPVTRVELVGDLDGTAYAQSPAPELSEQAIPTEPVDMRFAPKEFEQLSNLSMSKKPDLSIIGIGAGGGDFSRYGLTAGRGATAEFFGLGGTVRGARRIIYVVDRSGSMLGTFGHVRAELERSITALRRSQKFHVIFFNSGKPLENPPKELVPAIKAQKARFFEFMEQIYPEGRTDPAPAMRRALAAEPDVVYFLTDGEFDRDLIPKLDGWNRHRQVRIFTIAYFDQSGAELLEEIAREHGGEFKFVSEDELP